MNAIEQAREAGVELDEQNTITEELPCVGCGYLLCGLSPEQDCPECGRPASDTTRVQRLRRYPVTWLKQMRIGLALLCVTCMMFALAILIFAVNLQQNMRMSSTATLTVVDVLFVALLLPGATGFWLLTQPYQKAQKLLSWRRMARVMTLGSVLGFVLCLTIPGITERFGIMQMMGLITAWFAIGAWAMLMHASTIAKMVPHRQMARFNRRLGGLSLIYLIICAVYGGLLSGNLYFAKASIITSMILYNYGPVFGAGVLVVLCAVYVVVLRWYQRRFTEALSHQTTVKVNPQAV